MRTSDGCHHVSFAGNALLGRNGIVLWAYPRSFAGAEGLAVLTSGSAPQLAVLARGRNHGWGGNSSPMVKQNKAARVADICL